MSEVTAVQPTAQSSQPFSSQRWYASRIGSLSPLAATPAFPWIADYRATEYSIAPRLARLEPARSDRRDRVQRAASGARQPQRRRGQQEAAAAIGPQPGGQLLGVPHLAERDA